MESEAALIMEYGANIIETDLFQSGFNQAHHKVSTVANHSLNVAIEAVKYCIEYDLDESILEKIIIASLYHDLGIVDRTKYTNTFACWVKHPDDSVEIYLNYNSHVDDDILYAIQNHMKLKAIFSQNIVLRILARADKKASMKERLCKNYGKFVICDTLYENVA